MDRPSRPLTAVRQPKLISYRDEVARRMHLLKAVKGIDPWQAEMSMLRGSPLLQKLRIPRVSAKVSKERSARLQELINFCTTGGTTQTGRAALNYPFYPLHNYIICIEMQNISYFYLTLEIHLENFKRKLLYTHTEIDHAFKQFVMECMELPDVDEDGNVIPVNQGPKLIPWDDPYHYFKGLPVTEEQELDDERQIVVVENEVKDGMYFGFFKLTNLVN